MTLCVEGMGDDMVGKSDRRWKRGEGEIWRKY